MKNTVYLVLQMNTHLRSGTSEKIVPDGLKQAGETFFQTSEIGVKTTSIRERY